MAAPAALPEARPPKCERQHVKVARDVRRAQPVAPDDIVGPIDHAVLVEVARQHHADRAVDVQLRRVPFELSR